MRHSSFIERTQIIKLIIYLGMIFLMLWANSSNQFRFGEFMKFSNYNPFGSGNYATVTLEWGSHCPIVWNI